MTAPFQSVIGGGRKAPPDQAARRIDLKLKDQHGRWIHTVYDTFARGPIQSFLLFKAPFYLDSQYMDYVSDAGVPLPRSVHWNYARALADRHDAWDRYFADFRTIAGKLPGIDAMSAYEAATKGEWGKIPAVVLTEVGWTPEPTEYILAAMANNSWVLGLSPVIPQWAEAFERVREAKNRASSRGATEDDLARFRDTTDEPPYVELDDAMEAKGLGGGTVPIPHKPHVKPKGV